MKAAGRLVLILPAAVVLGLALWLWQQPGREKVIGAFSTSLKGRKSSQVHNVRLALASLDGEIIPPDAEFSFCRAVGPWSADKGYQRAPVSFSGDMVKDWGGGVCQASTTLYNAALLAGLPITERHRHYWAAHYVPPGQDAAVAYSNIDLRFRNCLACPIRISAGIVGESAIIRLNCRQAPPAAHLEREILAVNPPATVVRLNSYRAGGMIRGKPGYEVALYRVFEGSRQRELLSRDSYPAQNRIVWR
jgi:vancomycin resistance protein VanW